MSSSSYTEDKAPAIAAKGGDGGFAESRGAGEMTRMVGVSAAAPILYSSFAAKTFFCFFVTVHGLVACQAPDEPDGR
jgi:hypothetical protein